MDHNTSIQTYTIISVALLALFHVYGLELLDAYTSIDEDLLLKYFLVGAGIPYGFITAWFFIRLYKVSYLKSALWILASAVSYFVAVLVNLIIFFEYIEGSFSSYFTESIMLFALAGASSGMILVGAFHFLFAKLRLSRALTILLVATLVPVLMFLFENIRYGTTTEYDIASKLCFLVWPVVVTTLLLRYNKSAVFS